MVDYREAYWAPLHHVQILNTLFKATYMLTWMPWMYGFLEHVFITCHLDIKSPGYVCFKHAGEPFKAYDERTDTPKEEWLVDERAHNRDYFFFGCDPSRVYIDALYSTQLTPALQTFMSLINVPSSLFSANLPTPDNSKGALKPGVGALLVPYTAHIFSDLTRTLAIYPPFCAFTRTPAWELIPPWALVVGLAS